MSGAVLAPVAPPLIAAGPIGWAVLGLAMVTLTLATVVVARKAAEAFPDSPPSAIQPCPRQTPRGASDEPPPKTPEPDKPPPVLPPLPIDSTRPRLYPKWEPLDPDDTHPTHDEVEDARNEDSDDCGKIGLAIDVLVRDLKFRRWDMQRHGGGDAGHRKAYLDRQKDLRRLVDRAKSMRPPCPYNPEADQEINRTPRTPAPNY
jgi:hypothetical protein